MPGSRVRLLAVMLCSVSLSAAASPAAADRTVRLYWTAPGDDGRIGRAAQYEVRLSLQPIDALNFSSGLLVPGAPVPSAAGSPESLEVHSLPDNADLYFAIRTRDEAFNWSGISNLAILAGTPLGMPSGPSAVRFGPGAPNPASDGTQFEIELPAAAGVRIAIFDAAGRRVRVLAEGVRAAGQWSARWDLRDESGARVRPGVYIALAVLGGTRFTRRVTVVR